jgi:hypothetical protein
MPAPVHCEEHMREEKPETCGKKKTNRTIPIHVPHNTRQEDAFCHFDSIRKKKSKKTLVPVPWIAIMGSNHIPPKTILRQTPKDCIRAALVLLVVRAPSAAVVAPIATTTESAIAPITARLVVSGSLVSESA